jgi:hypothetical protein
MNLIVPKIQLGMIRLYEGGFGEPQWFVSRRGEWYRLQSGFSSPAIPESNIHWLDFATATVSCRGVCQPYEVVTLVYDKKTEQLNNEHS